MDNKEMITPLFRLCSLLMASLFALSASFQFNDHDWYLWLPLYATASIVNLVNGVFFAYRTVVHQAAKIALWLGMLLFLKAVIEDGTARGFGFWSLHMRERVVREKFGSGLVITCMFLQLEAINSFPTSANKLVKIRRNYLQYGIAVLVCISCGNSLVFFLFQKQEMKF